MKIAIIGAGKIGGTLGRAWAKAGHEVRFGVRNPADSKFDDVRVLGPVITVAQAIAGADVVLLALPGAAVADFAAEHSASLAGKVVVDATLKFRSPEMNSLAVLREKAPAAHLARAFSTLGWENFANPRLGGAAIDLFFCAQAEARPAAEQLIGDVGLRPVYLGDIDAAPTVDGLTRAWFALVSAQGRGRRLALKMMQE